MLRDFQSSGWITRFTDSRDARLRCLSWDLLTEMFSFEFFSQNQSLCWQALNTVSLENELYCVKISALKFLTKLTDCLALNCDIKDQESYEGITVCKLLDTISKQGLISQVHQVLAKKDCPLHMIALLLKFIS